MTVTRFFQLLILTIVILTGIMYLMSFNEKIAEYIDISYYAIPSFSLLCIVIFFLTEYLEKQSNKGMLLNLVIINVMFKFILTIAVVLIYFKLRNPDDGIFVLPFIIIYVLFTIFETYFMSLQAKSK